MLSFFHAFLAITFPFLALFVTSIGPQVLFAAIVLNAN